MDSVIKIENNILANYVMFKLDKIENEFTLEELDKVREIVIDYSDIDEEIDNSFSLLDELLKFRNIERITIRNGYIYNDSYRIFLQLNNLRKMVFEKCEFENVDLIVSLNLTGLSLIDCKINNYNFIGTLLDIDRLCIVNGQVDIDKINKLEGLISLQLSYSKIVSDNKEICLNNIEELYIDNTNIERFDFLLGLNHLKRVSIDREQYKMNKELFDKLMEGNVIVLYENMIQVGDMNGI